METRTIRIGTRDSQLALWQAKKVQQLLESQHYITELVPVKSVGDLDLVTPLYAMGVQGVFTKTLDAYLLSDKIDIAVHSMKDVPTQLATGLEKAAVLPRAEVHDVLILQSDKWHKDQQGSWEKNDSQTPFTIATGSVRRRAQWLNRYPDSQIDNLRGNVQTRLQKLATNNWDGAIFAAAGLSRMQLLSENCLSLDWMLPAPAQGAIMVVCREQDSYIKNCCLTMNDTFTDTCVTAERDFLSTLMGGCSTPIGAYAYIAADQIHFQGNILSPDGKHKLEVTLHEPYHLNSDIGKKAAQEILLKGADSIIEEIKKFEKDN